MGDRGNIVVRQEKDTNRGDVWFYTHWSGNQIAHAVHRALAKRERWNDDSYLARIIFCQLIDSDTEGTTGFGISTRMQDNEHPILVVDVPGQCVFFVEEERLANGRLPDECVRVTSTVKATFEEFATQVPEVVE